MAISSKRTLSALFGVAAAAALVAGCSSDSASGDGADGSSDTLTVPMNDGSGEQVATATFDFDDGYITVRVETTEPGKISPGFHGLHIHSNGVCEPDSVAPSGGDPGDFNSAGGHFQAPGHDSHPFSGDLTSLQVREDGSALLVTTTDTVTREELLADGGTAIMLHAGPDNFGNIPERYRQADGAAGPDEQTLSTGDAGARIACGVISD